MKEKIQFVYFLKLKPDFINDKNWTAKENDIVERHFIKLQGLLSDNKLILAGRTLTTDPCGIVILEVENEDEARILMENDPAVKEGLMTAELFPYRVALAKK